jgi:hypothetical protein
METVTYSMGEEQEASGWAAGAALNAWRLESTLHRFLLIYLDPSCPVLILTRHAAPRWLLDHLPDLDFSWSEVFRSGESIIPATS